LAIIILPAPWKTWWAYGLYVLVFTLIISSIAYQRELKLRERRENDRTTSENKEQLQLALWGSGDQLWDIDLTTQKITRKNLLSEIDYPDDDWHLPKLVDDLIHPDDKATMKEQILAHFDHASEYCEITYRAKSKAGKWVWLLDKGQVVQWDVKGKPLRFTGTTKNINHLKSTEKKLLILTEELERRGVLRTQELNLRTQELVQSNDYLKSTQSQLVEAEKMASLGGADGWCLS
jgi:PAS domain-containing protein